ncbi:hypothetical protein AGDE_08180 [Angomonas deanei]|nr:hypothetical protein AGDE_08180 [Angomonas deanei]|eukprot:EPY33645.1 hypothetical protein AGDE_08180 [Angomonas deanei]
MLRRCGNRFPTVRSGHSRWLSVSRPLCGPRDATPAEVLSAAPKEPVTYFDYLDKMWNTKWIGTVEAPAIEPTEAANSVFENIFIHCQSYFGVEAGCLILIFGALTRLFTLGFSFYGERASARMQLALPHLQKPQDDFNRVYYNTESSSQDVQIAASLLKNERRKVFKKYDTSNLKCLTSFAGAPFLMYGLYNVSSLCGNPLLDIGSSSFFWCPALSFPDPFFVLPITFCALTLLNFELSLSKEVKKGWMMNVVWAARAGCLCVIPVAANFRAGVCLYFIGMNLVGILQPTLLRVKAFREALGFPAKQTKEDVSLNDPLQASVSVQLPYLSHLLRPQAEENEDLFKRSEPSRTSRNVNKNAHHKYSSGKNPLMQEQPIRRPTGGSGSKGLHFASNWKAPSSNFSEDDFIPDYKNSGKRDDK